MMLQAFCVDTRLPRPLPPPTAPPQQRFVICRHILRPVLSSLISSPSLHVDSHTLTIIPDCCLPSHLFPWLRISPSPQWARIVSRVGSTLWKLSGSPGCVMRPTRASRSEGFSVRRSHEPAHATWQRPQHPSGPHCRPASNLDVHAPAQMPTHFTCDSSWRFL